MARGEREVCPPLFYFRIARKAVPFRKATLMADHVGENGRRQGDLKIPWEEANTPCGFVFKSPRPQPKPRPPAWMKMATNLLVPCSPAMGWGPHQGMTRPSALGLQAFSKLLLI